MTWNWRQGDWPHFRYNVAEMEALEAQFLRQSGVLIGAARHLPGEDRDALTVNLLSVEAIKTSEIEGEYLNRDSVQSSIRRNFGLDTDNRKIPPAERDIADMMVDLYRNFQKPLTHTMLFNWHKMLTSGRQDLKDIRRYRTHDDPMQVVSGPLHKPKVHFEAPASREMKREIDAFIAWFNRTGAKGETPLPALTRAGIAHLYFVCIHPFEDGNGRIGRALTEKALSQSLGQPTLIALSQTIESKRKLYYDTLELNNKDNEISLWLVYFAKTVLTAQNYAESLVNFLIEKTRLYDRMRGQLNERQEKVIARMFQQGPEGFKGGLSADNYITITGTSRATATRDLQDLVDKGVLLKTGELKGTRYYLNIQQRSRDVLPA